jgi:signal transduction histidine kinase
VLVLLCLFFYRLYRNQKRLFDAILDLPSSGFVFMINKYGKLRKVNDTGKELLNMTDNIPLGKQFRYYCSNEQTKQFADIAETGLVRRVNFNQKVDIISDNAPQEWLCSVVPLRNIAGRFHGIIITGIDITKELERQMLTNWAQLAHDMQTNLSTIRLNAEQIVPNNDDDQQRRSKILHQVNILRHRIRDIVTVGRDDKLERTIVNSTEFCNEVRQEFDDNIFSKIKFEMKLEDFNFICDKPKMLRAVRNAVENAIKYMKPEGGFITISCYRDIHSISISVKDTGIGMDAQTKSKIFVPFFSTARKTGGGYGIGTMIMQRVAELHGGKLIIESELGIGTEIIFKLPDLSRVKQ